jgi:hypothetical protein
MAVQPHPDGFLLSEVPPGTGFLDLQRVARALLEARPGIAFNLEMATRDPLVVPCRTEQYWATFAGRDEAKLEAARTLVAENPPGSPPPAVAGKPLDTVLAEEESNNRAGLAWMRAHLLPTA